MRKLRLNYEFSSKAKSRKLTIFVSSALSREQESVFFHVRQKNVGYSL